MDELLQTIGKKSRNNLFFFLILLFLIISTLVVFQSVWNYQFINFDDNEYVTENQYVQSGLTLRGILWAFTTSHAANWHPLTWLSHMLDCEIFELNPAGHHLTNLLLHIINTLLLFFVLNRMTGALWRSGFVAALFALHPLHVESVAWVAGRKDLLSTFFWILTMWTYVRYVEKPGLKRYLLVFLFFALGLMSKPMLVTLPFVLLLLDYWPFGRFKLGQADIHGNPIQIGTGNLRTYYYHLILEKVPLFVLSAVSSLITFFVQRSGGAIKSLVSLKLETRIANALVSYVTYIGKMIWPHHLSIFYPYPKSLSLWQVAGGLCYWRVSRLGLSLFDAGSPICWLDGCGILEPLCR